MFWPTDEAFLIALWGAKLSLAPFCTSGRRKAHTIPPCFSPPLIHAQDRSQLNCFVTRMRCDPPVNWARQIQSLNHSFKKPQKKRSSPRTLTPVVKSVEFLCFHVITGYKATAEYITYDWLDNISFISFDPVAVCSHLHVVRISGMEARNVLVPLCCRHLFHLYLILDFRSPLVAHRQPQDRRFLALHRTNLQFVLTVFPQMLIVFYRCNRSTDIIS